MTGDQGVAVRQFTAAELSERLGGRLEGSADLLLTGIADLQSAGPTQLAFFSNPRYRRQLAGSRAGAVLLKEGVPSAAPARIRLEDPYLGFARALRLFHPAHWPSGQVSERAYVHGSAELGEGVHIEPFAYVGAQAKIAAGSWVQAGSHVGVGATLGERCRLMPNSVVMEGCTLGDGVWLNPGAVVGSEGFGFAAGPAGLTKIPQVGSVIVQRDVEIGANSCVDRGALGDTVVGAGSKLDNLCQVAHGVTLGPHTAMVAYSGVAGSSTLGAGVQLAARSSVLGHLELGDGVKVAAHAMVSRDAGAGETLGGVPARSQLRWLRGARAVDELPELLVELRRLRQRVEELSLKSEDP